MNIYAKFYEGEKRSKGAFGRPVPAVCDIREEERNGVTLVYADVISAWPLDPDFGVGIDIEIYGDFMADYRSCSFWCTPAFGREMSKVPDETQLLAVKGGDGEFTVIVPVVGDTYRCVLFGKDAQTVTAKIYSGYSKLCTCKTLAFVKATGKDPLLLIEKCVKSALEALGSGIPHRDERKYPSVFEELGWCSWDALQIRVNHDGILEKCNEFKEKNIPVRWVLFDDMWAHVRDFYGRTYGTFREMVNIMHASALYDYEADPKRFEKGLASCIADVKKLGYKVGMWYPTTGYWRGIEQGGPAEKKLKPYLLETDDGILVSDYEEDKAYGYYSTINTFLKDCGADFIKVDNQSMYHRFYTRLAPVGKAARSFHNAIERATDECFGDGLINCMGTSSEDMWNRKKSAISRCSGDFQPENREWFAKHILQCSYNALIQGQFYWCDWDMWWTDDGQAEKNALARAVSGGPIYVSDQIGRSREGILEKLTLANGKILRCDNPAMPTADCVCTDPTDSGKPMKLQNICNGAGVMALFNLDKDNRCVSSEISPSEVAGLIGEEFAVYSHFDKSVRILKFNEKMRVTLENNDSFALYVFAPVKDGFAAIGRVDKFISPATVKSVADEKIELYESGEYAFVKDGKLHIVNG